MFAFTTILFFFVVLIALVILSYIRITLDANEKGLTVRINWLASEFGFATETGRISYRLFSKKLSERPITPSKERKVKKTKPKKRKRMSPKDASVFLRASWYFFKHLRWRYLQMQIVLASPDPALTGELYGYLISLASVLNIYPKVSIDIRPDFDNTTVKGQASLAVDIIVLRLFATGWLVGRQMLARRARRLFKLKGVRYATPRTT